MKKFTLFFAGAIALLFTAFFLPPVCADVARAEEEFSFAYDGATHVYVYEGAAEAPYAWYKRGSDEPVSTERELSVSHVSDGGEYVLYSLAGEPAEALTLTVVVAPRVVAPLWCVRRSPAAPAYVSSTRYIYNGKQQGVFPYPENVIAGDEIAFDVIGNVAVHAGSYEARILGLVGPNAGDYVLADGAEYFSYAVEKTPLTVTISDVTVVYGDPFEGTDVRYDGLADGDENVGEIATTYRVGDGVGTTRVTFSLTSDDYAATVREGVLTVAPRPLTLTFADGEFVYGEEPEPSYVIEGPRQFVLDVRPVLSDVHVGTRTLVSAYAGENFILTVNAATYEIKPRPLAATVTCPVLTYGETPVFSLELTEGSYAEGEDAGALRLLYPAIPRDVGRYEIRPSCAPCDYVATLSSCVVEIRPKAVTLAVSDVVARYGDAFLAPKVRASEPLPYGETVADLALDSEKTGGWTCGAYTLSFVANNPNYSVPKKTVRYTILPRELTVRLALPALGTVLKTGETLTPEYVADAPVGDDDATLSVKYFLIGESGVEEKDGVTVIETEGTYVARAVIEGADADNYVAVFKGSDAAASEPFTIYGDSVRENGVTVRTEYGFPLGATVAVRQEDVEAFRTQYESAYDLQSVVAAFSLHFFEVPTQKMHVSVPVEHDNRHYTAAIVKEDGSVVYTPCVVENGVATFTTEAASRTFFIWEDKDNTPYFYLCVFLAVLLVVELIVLGVLHGKYKSVKGAYAMAPLALTVFDGGGLFYFIGGAIVLGAACLVVLAAISVYAALIARKKKRVGRFKKLP